MFETVGVFIGSSPGTNEISMTILAVILLILVLIVSWMAQLIGLPGNWFIVWAVIFYAWWRGPDASGAISWNTVIVLASLAVAGELVEVAAGAMGVAKAGGSRRGALLAIAGSMVGSIVGFFVGLPIPVVGSLLAAVVFGGCGALVSAMLGESWKGRDFDHSIEIGKAAFVGRVLGTVGKLIITTIMVGLTLAAIVL